jgi:hypothetical protein
MPLRKIRDFKNDPKYAQCLSPDHDPPAGMCLDPGEYEWECPRCGKIARLVIPLRECGQHNGGVDKTKEYWLRKGLLG